MFSESFLDGMTAEVLYEGNFTSGSLTLKNAADVQAIIVNTIYDIPCFGSFLGGLGGYYGGTAANFISYRFNVTYSGNDVILFTDAGHIGVIDSNNNQNVALTRIIGIRAKNASASQRNASNSKKLM